MKTLNTVVASSACLFFLLVGFGNSQAALLYEISGDLYGQFSAVRHDPVADLLNLNRSSENTFPFKLSLVIASNNVPFIQVDTSNLQNFIYQNAIVSCELDLNGIKMETLRRPVQESNNFEINRIEIINSVANPGRDDLGINITSRAVPPDNLFDVYIVPFNQTVGGIFYENAVVRFFRFGFLVNNLALSSNSIFDGASLPVDNDGLNPLPPLAGLYVDLTIQLQGDNGPGHTIRLVNNVGLLPPGGMTFQISEIPDPPPHNPQEGFPWELFLPAIFSAD